MKFKYFGLERMEIFIGVLAFLVPLFFYQQAEGQLMVTPDSGHAGEDLAVTITGENFREDARVAMIPTFKSKTRILATLELDGGCFQTLMRSKGDHLYALCGDSGLQVVDVSSPEAPVVSGRVDISGSIYFDATIAGDRLYLTDYHDGLFVIDIQDPHQPRVLAQISKVGVTPIKWMQSVRVAGDTAFIAVHGINPETDMPDLNSDGVLYSINIRDIDSPRIQSIVQIPPEIRGMEITAERAFLLGDQELIQVDIGDPNRIFQINTLVLPGGGSSLYATNTTVFCANGERLLAIDYRDSDEMRIAGELDFETVGTPGNMLVIGTDLYHITSSYLWQVDVSATNRMKVTGLIYSHDLMGGDQVVISNDVAFVLADRYPGDMVLAAVEITAMDNPMVEFDGIVGAALAPGAKTLTPSGDYLFVAADGQDLSVLDITKPDSPSHVPVPVDVAREKPFLINDGMMVAGGNPLVRIYNVENPDNPVLMGTYDLQDEYELVGCAENKLFLVQSTIAEYHWDASPLYNHRLLILDVSDPATPVPKFTLDVEGGSFGKMTVSGDFALLTTHSSATVAHESYDSTHLQAILLDNPLGPVLGDSIRFSGNIRHAVVVAGNTAFLQAAGTLYAVDVQNPHDIFVLSTLPAPVVWAMNVFDSTLYTDSTVYLEDIRMYRTSIRAIDIDNPEQMRVDAVLYFPVVDNVGWDISDIYVGPENLFVSYKAVGVIVLPKPLPIQHVTVESSEKISATLPGPKWPGSYRLRVYDDAGYEAFSQPIVFNGVDDGQDPDDGDDDGQDPDDGDDDGQGPVDGNHGDSSGGSCFLRVLTGPLR